MLQWLTLFTWILNGLKRKRHLFGAEKLNRQRNRHFRNRHFRKVSVNKTFSPRHSAYIPSSVKSPLQTSASGLRPATLLKKRLWHKCFLVNFAKFLRTPFFTEHLRGLLPRISEPIPEVKIMCIGQWLGKYCILRRNWAKRSTGEVLRGLGESKRQENFAVSPPLLSLET